MTFETTDSATASNKPLGKLSARTTNSSSSDEDFLAPNPLFDKIRSTLQRTEPEKWRRSGEDFNADLKNPKPIEVWESVFVLAIKEGVLVLRCSIPLRSEYFGGGYSLIPTSDPIYTVEVREKGWNPRELTEAFHAHSHKKNLKVQKLLDGRMAKALYHEVKVIVESFNTEKRRTFERECLEIVSNLLSHVREMRFDAWKKDDGDPHIIRYHAKIFNMSIDIAQVNHGERISYHLKLGRDAMYKSINSPQIKNIFEAIEDLGRDANLEQLSKLLESIDL